MYPSGPQTQIETKNPRVNLLVSKWQQVWLLALERRRKLNDALDRLEEVWKLMRSSPRGLCVFLFRDGLHKSTGFSHINKILGSKCSCSETNTKIVSVARQW